LFRPGPKTLRYPTPVSDRGQLLSHVVRVRALRILLQEDCKIKLKTVKELGAPAPLCEAILESRV
jgi:hypothetical protein